MYRGYSQDELDTQYNNQATVPDYREYIDRYERLTQLARGGVDWIPDVEYGPGKEQLLDFYRPQQTAPASVVIFIHGGGWSQLSKAENGFAADAVTRCGAMLVVPDFALLPGRSLRSLVHQLYELIHWLHNNVNAYGGDPERLFVSGHSSGAHLASTLLMDGWKTRYKLTSNVLKGGFLVSGMYDLEPVRLSYRNQLLKLNSKSAHALSLRHNPPDSPVPLVVASGGLETNEFQRQASSLASLWALCDGDVNHLVVKDRNHFDVILDMAEEGSELLLALESLLSR